MPFIGFGTFSSLSAVVSVSGTANRITVTGTTSVVIDIAATYVGQTSITTLGTVTTGTWGTGAVIGGATITLGSDAIGDIYYRNAGGILTRLGIGTAGQVLTVAAGLPSWAAASGGSGWGLTGNAGTTAGTNFIGTTDAVDFVTKTNNTERMRILSGGTGYFGGAGQGAPLTTPFFNYLKTQDAPTILRVENQSTGTSAYAGLYLAGEVNAAHGSVPAGSHYAYIGLYSSTLSTAEFASTASFISGGDVVNGIRIYADNGYVKIGTSPLFVKNDFVIYKYNDADGVPLADYQSFIGIGTASPTARLDVTTAGSNTQAADNITIKARLTAGYTGALISYGGFFQNSSAGTGTDLGGFAMNVGAWNDARATTTGTNVGGVGFVMGGNVNVGLYGNATQTKNSATNIGVLGLAINAGSSPTQCAGYFGLQSATPTFASAALICDNGSTTSNIFVARDKGTACFTIADGGAVTLTGTTITLSTNATTIAATGTGANGLVLKNLKNSANTTVSGTVKTVEIDIAGTPYYFLVSPTTSA